MLRKLLLVALLLAPACDGDNATTVAASAGCGAGNLPAGTHAFTFDYDGRERFYEIHIPAVYDDEQPAPLVLNLHPYVLGGGAHDVWTALSGQNAKSEEAGYVVLHPDGSGQPASWNGGERCCSPANTDNVDDVGFIDALVRHTASQVCIDERRIYATGMSNGGYLAHRIACEFPGRLAAIAPVVGSMSAELECTDGRGVPVLQLSGSEDSLASRQASVDTWVEVNRCEPATKITHQQGGLTCTTHEMCKDGAVVTHCVVEGGAHCPFTDTQQLQPECTVRDDIVAQDLIWDFFADKRLP